MRLYRYCPWIATQICRAEIITLLWEVAICFCIVNKKNDEVGVAKTEKGHSTTHRLRFGMSLLFIYSRVQAELDICDYSILVITR